MPIWFNLIKIELADKFKNPNEPDKERGSEAKTTVDNAKKWVDASDGYATYEEPNPQT